MSLCYGRPGGGQQGRRLQAGPAGLPQLGYHGTSDGLLLNAVAGAAPCLCEPLVGAANQIPHILPPAVFPVEHRQRVPALVTEKQPFQWKLIGSAAGGNGVSLIIFAGIVARWSSVYSAVQNIILNVSAGKWYFIGFGALLVVFVLASIWFVVYVSGAERRVPIQYAGRTNGRVQYRSQSSFIPLKLIMSGVLPIIFASTILSLPQTIAMFMDATKHPQMVSMMAGFNSSNWIYCVLYIKA